MGEHCLANIQKESSREHQLRLILSKPKVPSARDCHENIQFRDRVLMDVSKIKVFKIFENGVSCGAI